jgi:hypothetical protein
VIFDVSDMANPQLVEQVTLGELGYLNTSAVFDPHAVALFNDAGILVVPSMIVDGNIIKDGFAEFTVDAINGFTNVGFIEQPISGSGRTFGIGGRIVTVSSGRIIVTAPLIPGVTIASLSY